MYYMNYKIMVNYIDGGAKVHPWSEVNALWESVKDLVPVDATFEELLDIAFIESFKIEMALTFGISINDIEEII